MAIFQVLVVVAVLTALSSGFYLAQRSLHARTAPDGDRARARAVAAAAWARARRDLARGGGATKLTRAEQPLLDGWARTSASALPDGALEVEVWARVEAALPSGGAPEQVWVQWRLRVRGGRVLQRDEVGA
ncbi:MAG: hypothetical protein AB7N76_13780 [Planctomycetota bacterium]